MIRYNKNSILDEDETFTINGALMNKINKLILDLEQQIVDLKDAEIKSELEDLRIRDKNPAVKDAWDQYQTVLHLSRNK